MKKIYLLLLAVICSVGTCMASWSLSYKIDGGSWSTVDPSSDGAVYLNLEANKTYYLYETIDNNAQWAATNEITKDNHTDITLSRYNDNNADEYSGLTIKTTIAGSYKFTASYVDNAQHLAVDYPSVYYLAGTWNMNSQNVWLLDDQVKFVNNSVTIHLDAFTLYDIKFYNAGYEKWTGNNWTMAPHNCTSWPFNDKDNNAKFLSADAGDYTFTLVWDGTTPKISATYPTPAVTPVTLEKDGNKVTYYASKTDNEYTLIIVSDKSLNGLGGSYWNTSNGNERTDTHLTRVNNNTLKIVVESTSAPQLYTPLYVLMPGEVNFGQPTITWNEIADSRATSNLALTTAATLNFDLASSTTTSQIEYTTSSTGAVTYESNNTAVATVSESGLITAVGVGSATITVNQAADATYKKGKLTIAVAVANSSTVPTHMYGKVSGVATNVWSGRDDPETHAGIFNEFPYVLYYDLVRNNDQTITARAVVDAAPAADGCELFSANGFVFQLVDYKTGTDYLNFVRNENGIYEVTTANTFTDGETAHFMFRMGYNAGAATPEIYPTIASINDKASVTVSEVGYSTYYTSEYAYVMPEGLTGYIFDAEQMKIVGTYEANAIVPAGEALVLEGEGDYNLNYTLTTATKNASNALLGTDVETALTEDADAYFYGLSLDENDANVGFYWMTEGGAAFTNGAHKAYLKLAKSLFTTSSPVQRRYLFNQQDTATDVDAVEAEEGMKFIENGMLFIKKNGVIYNAMGQIVK